MDDHLVAARCASGAGAVLLEVRRHSRARQTDAGGLRAEGDRRAHEHLVDELADLRPGDVVLSEEGADDPARLSADRVWIVDPLDGTREYAEGRSDWAVHVALWERGALVAGAVALPGLAVTLHTGAPIPPPPPRDGRPRLAVSRTRPPSVTGLLVDALGAELVEMGSAGAKAMAVVRGEAEVYAHAGGQYEWDSAAPVAVAAHAGLHTSRLDGRPLVYNQADPYLPDLLVCRSELAAEVIDAAKMTHG